MPLFRARFPTRPPRSATYCATLVFSRWTLQQEVNAEYVYRFQPVTEFTHESDRNESFALTMLDPWRMLVLERTDAVAKIYRVDLTKATNISIRSGTTLRPRRALNRWTMPGLLPPA